MANNRIMLVGPLLSSLLLLLIIHDGIVVHGGSCNSSSSSLEEKKRVETEEECRADYNNNDNIDRYDKDALIETICTNSDAEGDCFMHSGFETLVSNNKNNNNDHCSSNDNYDKNKASSWNEEEQAIPGWEPLETYFDTQKIMESSHEYMARMLQQDKASAKHDYGSCRNRHKHCSYWAAVGECKNSKSYMLLNCAPACHSCDFQLEDPEVRCAFEDTDETKIWKKHDNDLDTMFWNIVTNPYYRTAYNNITVHSSPIKNIISNNNKDTTTIQQQIQHQNQPNPSYPTTYFLKRKKEQSLPWVVTIDDFLTNEECIAMIRHGVARGHELSVLHSKDDGHSFQNAQHRSSQNTWCLGGCYDDPIIQKIHEKMENLTSLPRQNYEALQLLKYKKDGHYGRHHDYLPLMKDIEPGVRILTIFMYLNNVKEGGETCFPELGICAQPKKGRILVWPNVLNEDPDEKDPLTDHAALPVIKGMKYGANAWVHQRNYKEPFDKGCYS